MALEMELKYLGANLTELAKRMKSASGETTGPYLETNLVFDYPDRSLKAEGTLLRLREKQGKAVLTMKKLPEKPIPSFLKVFEETESVVGDFHAIKTILEGVGFSVAFGYEKVREKWRFMDCAVCLDRLPFGDFVEIEGAEDAVPNCAKALGLDSNQTTKMTYHALNIEHREKNGLKSNENFLFSDDDRAAIVLNFGKE